jgi:hypothetical protein
MVVPTERPGAPAPLVARPPFGATLALVIVLAVAAAAVTTSLALLVIQPKPLPPPLPSQNQDAETLAYLLAFAVIWWAAATTALRLAARARPWSALLALAHLAAPIWAIAAVLGLGALLCVTELGSISPIGLALSAIAAAGACVAQGRYRLPRLPGRWGAALDAAIVAAVLLAVPDLLIFRPEQAVGNAAVALETSVIQFHHDFLLGPSNEVLGGRAMLADTASQYGVTSIYLLVGWFLIAPIGYGTLGFLTGGLTALWFAAGYGVLRLARVSRLLAASALAIAVVVLVFNLSYPVGSLPQSGPLRFGLPLAVLLAAGAGERRPERAGLARFVALVVVGISAVWGLESFVYTVAVFLAVIGLQAWVSAVPGGLRWLARQAGLAAMAVVCAHVIFAVATLVAAGRFPDWGEYLAYLDAFLFSELGDLTYDTPAWSPAFAVAAAYLASAAAVVELARRGGSWVQRERPTLVALAGTSVYGIALFGYYVDRSLDHILIYVGLPAVLMCTLWLSLLLRSPAHVSRAARMGGLGFGLAIAVLVVSVAWSSIGDRFPRSALARVAPGGESLRRSLHRLWHPPPMDATALAGERQLARYMPGEDRSIVMVAPDVGIEILIRSGRRDTLELGDAWESSFVAGRHLSRLAKAIAALRPGDRMLMDQRARSVLGKLRAQPSLDPLRITPLQLAPLQQWALKRIDERFRLEPVGRADGGFTVVALAARA